MFFNLLFMYYELIRLSIEYENNLNEMFKNNKDVEFLKEIRSFKTVFSKKEILNRPIEKTVRFDKEQLVHFISDISLFKDDIEFIESGFYSFEYTLRLTINDLFLKDVFFLFESGLYQFKNDFKFSIIIKKGHYNDSIFIFLTFKKLENKLKFMDLLTFNKKIGLYKSERKLLKEIRNYKKVGFYDKLGHLKDRKEQLEQRQITLKKRCDFLIGRYLSVCKHYNYKKSRLSGYFKQFIEIHENLDCLKIELIDLLFELKTVENELRDISKEIASIQYSDFSDKYLYKQSVYEDYDNFNYYKQ